MVAGRFGNVKRIFIRPSSGLEWNDDPGTLATPGSAARLEAPKQDVPSGGSAGDGDIGLRIDRRAG